MSLASRDAELTELMDDPGCDPRRLRRTLHRFEIVNQAVSGWGRVWSSLIRPEIDRLGGRARILDIGCGGGDVLRRLSRLAQRDGVVLDALGVDPDERAIRVATERAIPGVRFRSLHSRELVTAGDRFDVVISNHLLHHLSEPQLRGLIEDSVALGALSLHSDIARGRLAYAAYAVGIVPLAPGTFLRTDGLRSIRRSYAPHELRDALPLEWGVLRPAPFRLLAAHRGSAQ